MLSIVCFPSANHIDLTINAISSERSCMQITAKWIALEADYMLFAISRIGFVYKAVPFAVHDDKGNVHKCSVVTNGQHVRTTQLKSRSK